MARDNLTDFEWLMSGPLLPTGHDHVLPMRVVRMSARACLHSPYPNHSACEVDEAHEGGERFFASQGNSSEAFEFIEEAFDLMAFLVEAPVDRGHGGATGIGLDLCGCTEFISDEGAQRISIICGIGDDMADALQTGQKCFGLWPVPVLPRCWMNA